MTQPILQPGWGCVYTVYLLNWPTAQHLCSTHSANSLFWWQWIKSFASCLQTASRHEVTVRSSHLELSQVPHFENSVVAAGQQEGFAPVPADHVDVRGVRLVGREHGVGWGTHVPDANGLIHRTRSKDLNKTKQQHNMSHGSKFTKQNRLPTQSLTLIHSSFWCFILMK